MKPLALMLLVCLSALALAGCGVGGAEEPAATPVDLDLSALSGTVVYSQVYDMLLEPEAYVGQRVRVRGTLSYFQNPETQREYFAALIADATACCAQGVEFEWAGQHEYPQDYPPLGATITVTGTFATYEENGVKYVHLTDAEVEW